MREDIVMLFLHGGKQGSWIWDEVRAAVALQGGDAAPATFALDVPGCGTKRGRDVAALTLADVVDELAADIAAIGARRFMLVGHSQAGTVLPRLADALRPRVVQLTYVACAVPAEGQTIGAMLGTGLHGEHDDCIGWPIDPATSSPQAMTAAMFCNDMDDAQQAAFLAKLGSDDWPPACATTETEWRYGAVRDIPATYIVAMRDQILTPHWQGRFADRLGATRRDDVDAGHQLLQTRPQAVAEILLPIGKDCA
ncbi:MAG: alpha/beta hydrolase [Sphingobium sp.]